LKKLPKNSASNKKVRYSLDRKGLPRLKSGELCMGSGWVKVLKALASLPNGRANSARELADAAQKVCGASWWGIYKRWHWVPQGLVSRRKIGSKYRIALTKAAWEIVRTGNFGKVY
jgi:hypothetical protein